MPHRNTFTHNTMIAAFAKAGLMDEALALFLSMPEPDQCSRNSMVSGLSQHGRYEEAMGFFSAMHAEDFVLNGYSFSSALSACAAMTDLASGTQIHALIAKSRHACDVYMGSALVDMYSKCRYSSCARRMFEEMPERNVVSWNSLITCYEQNGPAGEALHLFVWMMRCGIEPDEVTFASVASACATLSAVRQGRQVHAQAVKSDVFREDLVLCNALVDMYAKCSRVSDARRVFDRMPKRSVVSLTSMISGYAKSASTNDANLMFLRMTERNIIAWNALIAGYTQNGEDEEALRLFRLLKRDNISPTHYTFGTILNACANLTVLHLGKQLHAHVLKHGLRFEASPEPDIFVGNSLVDMYLKCGSIDAGVKVFERMKGRDKVSWNVMIVGYAQNGLGEDALFLFKRMLESGEAPDQVTMIGVLSGCSHAGLVNEGKRYFRSMVEDHGIVPCRDHYTCMIDMLGRAGRLGEMEEFVEEMPLTPDPVLFASLLSACRAHGLVETAEWAANKLLELDSKTSGPYVLLSNMYAEMRRWEDVVRIRKLMKKKGVVKQPGCSWIEIEGKMNVFMVRDRRHRQKKEIYGALKCLRCQMEKTDTHFASSFVS